MSSLAQGCLSHLFNIYHLLKCLSKSSVYLLSNTFDIKILSVLPFFPGFHDLLQGYSFTNTQHHDLGATGAVDPPGPGVGLQAPHRLVLLPWRQVHGGGIRFLIYKK